MIICHYTLAPRNEKIKAESGLSPVFYRFFRFEQPMTNEDTEVEAKEWLKQVDESILRCPDDKMDPPYVWYFKNMSFNSFRAAWESMAGI